MTQKLLNRFPGEGKDMGQERMQIKCVQTKRPPCTIGLKSANETFVQSVFIYPKQTVDCCQNYSFFIIIVHYITTLPWQASQWDKTVSYMSCTIKELSNLLNVGKSKDPQLISVLYPVHERIVHAEIRDHIFYCTSKSLQSPLSICVARVTFVQTQPFKRKMIDVFSCSPLLSLSLWPLRLVLIETLWSSRSWSEHPSNRLHFDEFLWDQSVPTAGSKTSGSPWSQPVKKNYDTCDTRWKRVSSILSLSEWTQPPLNHNIIQLCVRRAPPHVVATSLQTVRALLWKVEMSGSRKLGL